MTELFKLLARYDVEMHVSTEIGRLRVVFGRDKMFKSYEIDKYLLDRAGHGYIEEVLFDVLVRFLKSCASENFQLWNQMVGDDSLRAMLS